MRVAICDSDLTAQDKLCAYIEEYSRRSNLSITTERFLNGESFLKSPADFDAVFMEINLHSINGIETMQSYRRLHYPCIVFVTSSNEFAAEAFELNAVHYLLKPVTRSGVEDAMRRCIKQLNLMPVQTINVKVGSNIVPIPAGNIIYIEVFNKLSVIHTHKGLYETHLSLNSLYRCLNPETFIHLQRSYIVNMYEIDSFHSDRVVLKDKTILSISRLNRDELKEQYQNFLYKLAREGQI